MVLSLFFIPCKAVTFIIHSEKRDEELAACSKADKQGIVHLHQIVLGGEYFLLCTNQFIILFVFLQTCHMAIYSFQ